MKHLFCAVASLCSAAALALPTSAAEAPPELHAPRQHPGYPDFMSLGYMVNPDSISPNGNFAVAHPTRATGTGESSVVQDFLVSLHPFKVLSLLPCDEPYFEGQGHGGLHVSWTEDSAAALVEIEGKWGPRAVDLVELKAGAAVHVTNLAAKVEAALATDFKKVTPKPESFNDNFPFILSTDDEGAGFTLEGSKVRITCGGTTDPKGDDPNRWSAKAVAVYDLAQGKFTSMKVTRTSKGRRRG